MMISVIIPMLNAADTITRTLESVLGQETFHCEVIIVDNGSSDNSVEVLAPYRNQIILLKCNEPGAAHARNLGASSSSTKILAFLDAGDTWELNKLVQQTPENLAANELRGCYAAFRGENGRILGKSVRSRTDSQATEMAKKATSMPFLTSSWLITKEAFVETGGFNPLFKNAQDLDFINRFALSGGRISVVREQLVNYEMNPKSLTAENYKRQFLSAQYIRDRSSGAINNRLTLTEYLMKNGRFPSKLWRLSTAGNLFRQAMNERAKSNWFLCSRYALFSLILSPMGVLRRFYQQSKLLDCLHI